MINKQKILGKCLEILLHKDHPSPMVRGIVADSDLDLEGSMIRVLPWPADHPLAKLTTCVQVPYHISIYDIAGIMELEHGQKSADGTGDSAGSGSNKENIKKDDSSKNIVRNAGTSDGGNVILTDTGV